MSTSTAADSAQTVMSYHHVIERHPAAPAPIRPHHSEAPTAVKLESHSRYPKSKKPRIFKNFYDSEQKSSSLCRKYGKWHFYLNETRDESVVPKKWRLFSEKTAQNLPSTIWSAINDAIYRERISIRSEINVSSTGQCSNSQVDTQRNSGMIPSTSKKAILPSSVSKGKTPPESRRETEKGDGGTSTVRKTTATIIDQPEKAPPRMEFKLMHEVELESKIVNRISGTEHNVQILRYRMENDVNKPMTDESKFR